MAGALQSSTKMAYFTNVEKEKWVLQIEQNHSATFVSDGFARIMIKKQLQEHTLTSGTNHLLKLVAFVLRTIIQADDQVTRAWRMSVPYCSMLRRNPQGGQTSNWVTSLAWQCWGCYVSYCPSGRTNAGVRAQCLTTSDRLLYRYAEPPGRGQYA